MTMDIITYHSFSQSVDATNAPDFKAPIIEAMDASNPIFIRFKHSEIYKNMILKCPSNLSRKISPETSGLLDLQEVSTSEQINRSDILRHKIILIKGNPSLFSAISETSHRTRSVSKTFPTK